MASPTTPAIRTSKNDAMQATAGIDAAIDDMLPVVRKKPEPSLLSVMLEAGMPLDSVRANIKLTISGGQNEPRDAIAGCIWALVTHPDQLGGRTGNGDHELAPGVRGILPLDLSHRHVAAARGAGSHEFGGVTFEPEERDLFHVRFRQSR